MRNFFKLQLLLVTLVASNFSFAHLEHESGMGKAPSAERLSKQRGCFRDLKNLGCPHPREDQVIFKTCLSEKKNQLSESCQTFFERLYGKKI